MSTREMSLSPSASWRCRSTPPTQCGCRSGKPSGSFSSWPSEEQRAEGGRSEGGWGRKEGGGWGNGGEGGGGGDGKLTGRCRHIFSDTWRVRWAQERKTRSADLFFFAILQNNRKRKIFHRRNNMEDVPFLALSVLKTNWHLCYKVPSKSCYSLIDGRLPLRTPDMFSSHTLVSSTFYVNFGSFKWSNSERKYALMSSVDKLWLINIRITSRTRYFVLILQRKLLQVIHLVQL